MTYVREALPAIQKGAFVRFVSCMSSTVDSQGAALNERLVARLVFTCVWALVGMDSVVTLKVGFPIEALGDDRLISLKLCAYNDS